MATEAGNSANMVHRHYKALVTEAQGKEWFSIQPVADSGASILPFQTETAPGVRASVATA